MSRPPEDRLTRLETTVWGAHGDNGLTATSRHHSRQIGELYERDAKISKSLNDKLDKKFRWVYGFLGTITVAIIAGLFAIISALTPGAPL